jgi:hypothetical protein
MLRNAGLRAPFFHNGSTIDMFTLMIFYQVGGDFPGPNLDTRMVPLSLTHAERLQLMDFVQNGLTDPRVAAQTYPFDRPTLNSEIPANFPARYGMGSPGTGGVVPIILGPHSSFLGNSHFVFGIASALGGTTAALGISGAQALPGATLGGNPLWIDLSSVVLFNPLPLLGTTGTAGAGYTSFVIDLPYDPALANVSAYLQAGAFDAAGTGGMAVTAGSQITLIDLGP